MTMMNYSIEDNNNGRALGRDVYFTGDTRIEFKSVSVRTRNNRYLIEVSFTDKTNEEYVVEQKVIFDDSERLSIEHTTVSKITKSLKKSDAAPYLSDQEYQMMVVVSTIMSMYMMTIFKEHDGIDANLSMLISRSYIRGLRTQ